MNTLYYGDNLKIFELIVVVVLLFGVIGCGGPNSNNLTRIEENSSRAAQPAAAPPPSTTERLTSETVLNAFKSANVPVYNVEVYTEETDPNKLLGRPNQYVGKTNFADRRIGGRGSEKAPNSIEVFQDLEDLESRKNYTEAISKSGGPFAQYIFSHKNVLLRLSPDLLPKDAAQYESILKSL